ncbi:MAG: tRNA threonylcarbamoyladenosine dehydratase [Chthoniobacteraceae bacterium]
MNTTPLPVAESLTEAYRQRFGGLGRLFGTDALPRLQAAHVLVVGVGGVGSWTVEALARSGIGRITMVDLDDVCITNVNRQLPAVEGQIGRPKIAVLADRVKSINPECEVHEVAEFFTKENADRLLSTPYDFVVDAIDQVSLKALLIAECRQRGRRVITVGGAGGKQEASGIRVADLAESAQDDLLRFVRKQLRAEHGFSRVDREPFGVRCVFSIERPHYPWPDGTVQREKPPACNLKLDCASGYGTASFVTGAFGLAAAGEVVRVLAAG